MISTIISVTLLLMIGIWVYVLHREQTHWWDTLAEMQVQLDDLEDRILSLETDHPD